MSLVNSHIFLPNATAEERYAAVNTLAVSELEFAQISNLFSRYYGVVTGAEEGGEMFEKMFVNACVRQQFFRVSLAIQEETERYLGYLVRGRYLQETQTMTNSLRRLATTYPGVKNMGYELVYADIAGLSLVDVSPYFATGMTPYTDGAYTILVLPKEFADNPHDVTVWDDNTATAYGYDTSAPRYPRRDVNGDWLVPIGSSAKRWQMGDDVCAQHRRYLFVEVTLPTAIPAGSTLVPVYPGTTQELQFQKMELVSGTTYRFTFYIYTLIDPAFTSRPTDLIQGEFYKLLPEIEFKYRREQAAPATLTRRIGTTVDTITVQTRLVDAAQGAFEVYSLDGATCFPTCVEAFNACDTCTELLHDNSGEPIYTLTYHYQSDPSMLEERFRSYLHTVRTAMAHRIAAELPYKDCGCSIEVGFIAEQQSAYGNRFYNIMAGVEVVQTKFGNLYGQVFYAEKMAKAPIYRHASFL